MELGSELRGSQGGSIPCLPRIISGAAHGCCRAVSGPGLLPGSGFGVRCQSLYLVFFSGCGKPATPAGAEFRWLLSVSGPGSYGKQRSQSCSNLLADELKGCFDPSGYLKIIYFFFNLPSPSFTRGPRQELCVGRQRNYSKSRRVDVPGGCFIAGFHSPFYFFSPSPTPLIALAPPLPTRVRCGRGTPRCRERPRWGHGDSFGPTGPRRRGGAPQTRVLFMGSVLREPGRVLFWGCLSPPGKLLTPTWAALPWRLSALEAPRASGSPLQRGCRGRPGEVFLCPQIHTGCPAARFSGMGRSTECSRGREVRVRTVSSFAAPARGLQGGQGGRAACAGLCCCPLHGLGCAHQAVGCQEGNHNLKPRPQPGAGGSWCAPCCLQPPGTHHPLGLAPALGLPLYGASWGHASTVWVHILSPKGFLWDFLGVTAVSTCEHASNPNGRVSRSTSGLAVLLKPVLGFLNMD